MPNKGVCQWRATNGKPAFFVCYEKQGETFYEWFACVYPMYRRYDQLLLEWVL